MRACLVYEPRKQHQIDYLTAFADGLRSHGVSVALGDSYAEADLCVVWGAKTAPRAYERELRIEAGYINGQSGDYVRDRLQSLSLSWGKLHGRAVPPPDCPPDRWDALDINLVEWHSAHEILCCLNHPNDLTAPQHKWWLDYPTARIRHHPLICPQQESLARALRDCGLCVTWNSTSGIEAVIAGVHVEALDEGSMIFELARQKPWESLERSRDQWAHNLAYRQWSRAELQSGEAWEFARYGMETNQHDNGAD